jgi:hypothetical protein
MERIDNQESLPCLVLFPSAIFTLTSRSEQSSEYVAVTKSTTYKRRYGCIHPNSERASVKKANLNSNGHQLMRMNGLG